MLYLPFNVYLDSKRVSKLIEAVLPTLPMLYLSYLDSERVSILTEAVLLTLPMLSLPFNSLLNGDTTLSNLSHHLSFFPQCTKEVPLLNNNQFLKRDTTFTVTMTMLTYSGQSEGKKQIQFVFRNSIIPCRTVLFFGVPFHVVKLLQL